MLLSILLRFVLLVLIIFSSVLICKKIIKSDKKSKLKESIDEKNYQSELNEISKKESKNFSQIIEESKKRDSFTDKF